MAKRLDFACGFPGSMHDVRVLRGSTLFRRAEHGDILTAPATLINGREIRPYLLGDSAYPLCPWLMKPYPEGTRDPDEINFNFQLSSARVRPTLGPKVAQSRLKSPKVA